MTNDTNTLNGALQELGETMADNLTTMGVPSTYDEGLTTLAQKILSIGPTPPTPVVSSVSLSADKSILSYADSQSATLSATVLDSNDDPMEGVTVTFYNGSTSMGTADTNSSGVATKSYASAGSGDVSFTATVGTISSETYELQDCLLYDSTEYSRTGTGSATSVASNNKTWDNTVNWQFEADIKVTGVACRIDIVPPSQSLNYHLGIGKNAAGYLACYVGKNGGGEDSPEYPSVSYSNNTYYPVKVTKEGTTIKWYFNDTLIRTDTTYAQAWIGNYSTESVKFTTWRSNTIYMKNIKVKPL